MHDFCFNPLVTFPGSILALLMRRTSTRLLLCAAIIGALGNHAFAYVLNGKTWASGTITMQLGLGNAGRTLTMEQAIAFALEKSNALVIPPRAAD